MGGAGPGGPRWPFGPAPPQARLWGGRKIVGEHQRAWDARGRCQVLCPHVLAARRSDSGLNSDVLAASKCGWLALGRSSCCQAARWRHLEAPSLPGRARAEPAAPHRALSRPQQGVGVAPRDVALQGLVPSPQWWAGVERQPCSLVLVGHLDVNAVSYCLPDGRPLLDFVSLRVGEGAKVALIGPNGTGKTSLSRIISGDLAAAEGAVTRSGGLGVMRQFIGSLRDDWSVRGLLVSVAPPAVRTAAAARPRRECSRWTTSRPRWRMRSPWRIGLTRADTSTRPSGTSARRRRSAYRSSRRSGAR